LRDKSYVKARSKSIMLDPLGTISIGGSLSAILAVIVCTVAAPLLQRVAFAVLAGLWIGLAVALSANGHITSLATFVVMFALPLFAAAISAAALPKVRSAMMSIPVPAIVATNVIRLLGVWFLMLAAAGQLSGPFPYFAGIGDVITGLFAIPVARLAARLPASDVRIAAWNAFGLLDLVVAVVLGVTSRNGSPLQLIHAGVGSDALTAFPWVFVPLVLVPAFIVGHAVVFAHARDEERSRLAVSHTAVTI
jgi:hypothetical protein